jgi:hypothetical protein
MAILVQHGAGHEAHPMAAMMQDVGAHIKPEAMER